ncbi:hypothetical protein ASPVEDRAFT_129724 [Aspergillus versicolor CBS 583.65]|uniref:Amino acid permease/ SLC12A domain-containing protein n=1 Tax=Aspergillus versicolor CBS 583.65 TaxID=1036611 RepID=A0A1L9PJM6_ASPVE|nr:uncharacterized protein ASPVEDRAFT_129724 [Aspergillus versicolor CBS 583.65]OJJ01691.1 hypothetical protein ASPVEDRAFT_129724 [Aspergillus versicolor CBS 583.65]
MGPKEDHSINDRNTRSESISPGTVQRVASGHGQYLRSFSPRQVHVMGLGASIGSGIFIGTGKSLFTGGPGSLLLSYCLIVVCVWAVIQSLFEMTIAFPTSGNYLDFADRWVDPALAFGSGIAEWIGWAASAAAEASFFAVLVNYWAEERVNNAAWLTIFTVIYILAFFLPNQVFAWMQYVCCIVKILLLLLLLLASLVVICGAGSDGYVHDGHFWTDLPAFKGSFTGFAKCTLLASWAVGDQIFLGVIGGETANPRYSMAHTAKLVPWRVIVLYVTTAVFITLLVPSNSDRLLGGSGSQASPFLIAFDDVGIRVLPDIMNAGMMIGIIANGSESFYLASRVLRAMSHQRLIPERLARVDEMGRPRMAQLVTGVLVLTMTYVSLTAGGSEVLTWLVNITSSAIACNWLIISVTSLRFHAAIKAQKDDLFSEPYAWKLQSYPLPPIALMILSLFLIGCSLTAGIDSNGTPNDRLQNFFTYTIGLVMVIICTVGYKVLMRTSWRSRDTADCVTGRRRLTRDEIVFLDNYYRQPRWRRFLEYIRLW